MYMLWDVLLHGGWNMYRQPSLSQHFLVNRELIAKLVRASSVSPSDLVLEIGPGKGNITSQLLATGCQVSAIELDRNLASKIPPHPHLSIIRQNFLDYALPRNPYKVFSNLPFVITNDIFRKLFLASNPPKDSYLIMQTEAATKFLSQGTTHSLISMLIYPWFETKILHHFSKSDFYPKPRVDSCLLQVKRRQTPLVTNQSEYRDFATYTYTYNSLAKYIPSQTWIKTHHFLPQASGSFHRWLSNQSHLFKIRRTRTNPGWQKMV